MTDTDLELDLARFPHETRRALDRECLLPEMVDPGLYVRPEPDLDLIVVMDRHGNDLCSIALGRLRPIDPERLRPFADAALSALPVDLADQLATAINAGEAVVNDPPDSEWVTVDVGDHKLMAVHRAHLVDGWPDEDLEVYGDDDLPPAA